MRFLMICYMNPAEFGKLSPEQIGTHLGAYAAYNRVAQAAGVLRNAEEGLSQVAPFHVTRRDGQAVATDGTIQPLNHFFGGLYILNVTDRAEAEAWAAKIPTVVDGVGTVEIHALADSPTV